MMRKHEDQIINFFQHGITNAKAERLNGKIKRFVTNNYGVKDKDFVHVVFLLLEQQKYNIGRNCQGVARFLEKV